MTEFLVKLRRYIKHRASFYATAKKILFLPIVAPIYRWVRHFVLPPQERFDPHSPDAEFDYFESYASAVAEYAHGDVLDIGCGLGYLTDRIAKRDSVKSIVALDKIEPTEFRFLHDPKIHFKQCDITALREPIGSFDVIVSTEFVEHIHEKDFVHLLPFIHRSLKKGGLFVGSTPINVTPNVTFSACPFHVREYQPDVFTAILKKAGFTSVKLHPAGDCFIWEARP